MLRFSRFIRSHANLVSPLSQLQLSVPQRSMTSALPVPPDAKELETRVFELEIQLGFIRHQLEDTQRRVHIYARAPPPSSPSLTATQPVVEMPQHDARDIDAYWVDSTPVLDSDDATRRK